MKTQPIIPFDSPEAAQEVTVTGWRSRDGFFYGNGPRAEETARYAGCTHQPCRDCGKLTEKMYSLCVGCREKADLARFLALPRGPWDGEQMLYSDARDKYYSTPEDVLDDLEEGQQLEDLRLVLCKPNRARPIEEDHFCDDLPEDGDVPPELAAALQVLNDVIVNLPALSWSPGKVAWDCEVAP